MTAALPTVAASASGVEPNSFATRDVGAGRDQPLDEREVVVVDGPVQRRRAVGALSR